jgi:hypothetical protein
MNSSLLVSIARVMNPNDKRFTITPPSSITSINRAGALQTKITPPVPNHSTTDKMSYFFGKIP